MSVCDAETGEEMLVDTSSKKVRRLQAAWWRGLQGRLQDTFQRSGVDTVSVRTDEDYVTALMRMFKSRA